MKGKRIVLCASRKLAEMTTLIEKQGGVALVRSAQGTVLAREDELVQDIRNMMAHPPHWIIFTTGIGVEAMLAAAERGGMKEEWLEMVRRSRVAVRGYKTAAALKKLGVSPAAESDDGTTQGLIRALQPFSFENERVALQLYGDTAPALKRFLAEGGAVYTELLPYRHVAPDAEVLEQLHQEIIGGQVDAVCFTAAIQVRFFFSFVKENKDWEPLRRAFSERVVACAVGKVTAEALAEEGVERIVSPELERMGAMIVTLAKYFEQQDRRG